MLRRWKEKEENYIVERIKYIKKRRCTQKKVEMEDKKRLQKKQKQIHGAGSSFFFYG